MRKILAALAWLLWLLPGTGWASPVPRLPPVPDSLRQVLRAATTPTARAQALLRIGRAYLEPLDSAGVVQYAEAAEQVARRLADNNLLGEALDLRGHYYQQVSNQTLAQPLLERAEILLVAAPPLARATNYYHLGWLYDELAQPGRALRYYRRAYALAGQVHDVSLQASVLNSWSSVYMYRQQYDSAQYYMLRSLQLAHQLGQPAGEATSLGNLASILKMAGRPRAALPYARQAAALQLALHDSVSLADTYNTLGDLSNSLDSLTQARRYFRAALALGHRYRSEGALSMSYVGLADVYNKTGMLDSAEFYYLRAIRQAEHSHNVINLPELLVSLVRLYARQPRRLAEASTWAARLQALPTTEGRQPVLAVEALAVVAEARHDYPRALALHKQLDGLRTQALASTNERLAQELRVQFDTERAEQQVALLEKDRELSGLRTRQQVAGVALLAALALALAGGLLWRYRRRQRRREETLRHQLAADLHDDVGSLLSRIALQTDLLQEGLGQPAQWAEVAENSRMAVRQLNEVVWNLDAENDSIPNLLDRLRDYAYDVLAPTGREVHFVGHEAGGAAPELVAPLRRQLYLIFKEALHNIIKYAPADATVTVGFRRTRAALVLEIVNSGPPGAPVPAGRSSGHGLRNIEARVATLGGTATAGPVASGGFAVVVQVPL